MDLVVSWDVEADSPPYGVPPRLILRRHSTVEGEPEVVARLTWRVRRPAGLTTEVASVEVVLRYPVSVGGGDRDGNAVVSRDIKRILSGLADVIPEPT